MSEKMYAAPIEKGKETPDRVEDRENKKIERAMKLLRQILDDFGASEFTYDDLKDNGLDANRESLDILVSKEILFFDKETKEYSVNHDSSYVAEIEMDPGLEGKIDKPSEN